jgi:hypothetical protein
MYGSFVWAESLERHPQHAATKYCKEVVAFLAKIDNSVLAWLSAAL